MYTPVTATVRSASPTPEPNPVTATRLAYGSRASSSRRSACPPYRPTPSAIASPKFPLFVRLLLLVQHASSLVAVSAIAIVLVIYATSVYTQRAWNREYRQLRDLQHQERNLVATSESLRYHLAEQANSQTHLVPTDPSKTIYLPATAPPAAKPETPETPIPLLRPQIQSPIAY